MEDQACQTRPIATRLKIAEGICPWCHQQEMSGSHFTGSFYICDRELSEVLAKTVAEAATTLRNAADLLAMTQIQLYCFYEAERVNGSGHGNMNALAHCESEIGHFLGRLNFCPPIERDWRKLSICEIGAENQSVSEYMAHWEKRALEAEKKVAQFLDSYNVKQETRSARQGHEHD